MQCATFDQIHPKVELLLDIKSGWMNSEKSLWGSDTRTKEELVPIGNNLFIISSSILQFLSVVWSPGFSEVFLNVLEVYYSILFLKDTYQGVIQVS